MIRRAPAPEHLEALFTVIRRAVDIPRSELDFAARQYEERSFRKGELLARADRHLPHSFFIVKGLVRLFYTTPKGREVNKGFAPEHRLVGSYASKFLGEPAGFSIQAMEGTVTLVMDTDVADRLLDRHPAWERLRRMTIERLFHEKEKRERELLLLSASERYRRFMAENRDIANRIPQYHIASYLGITEVALSRIRGRLAS